jgi:uncharacterized C2H2 Zn-finger protein
MMEKGVTVPLAIFLIVIQVTCYVVEDAKNLLEGLLGNIRNEQNQEIFVALLCCWCSCLIGLVHLKYFIYFRSFGFLMDDSVFNCPYCNCVFCSKADLNRHLKAFGLKGVVHKRKFMRKHRSAEFGLEREHGGADHVIHDLERIILEYKAELTEKKRDEV